MRRSKITDFGKALRKLRIDHEMLMGDLAEKLNVSAAFLSAVENGKKSIPNSWVDLIAKIFSLPYEEEMQIAKLVFDSNGSFIFSEKDDDEDNMLMISFARKLDNLDDEKKDEIRRLLEV